MITPTIQLNKKNPLMQAWRRGMRGSGQGLLRQSHFLVPCQQGRLQMDGTVNHMLAGEGR